PPAFSTSPGNQNPGTHVHPDDAEQQAALLLACSGDNLPPSLPPVNMYDLLEALKGLYVFIPSPSEFDISASAGTLLFATEVPSELTSPGLMDDFETKPTEDSEVQNNYIGYN
ncbi:hypothetical protein AB205_0045330, partial [Aquarana catesbeiana]